MAKGATKDVLYRVVKFQIFPDRKQLKYLRRVTRNLGRVYNEALHHRQTVFDQNIAPLYEELKAAKGEAERVIELKSQIKAAYKDHAVTLFDQINALTQKRKDVSFGSVPRNWQEEVLDALNGAFASFMALRKNGDLDARTPRPRIEGQFHEIPGRSGFKILRENDILKIRLGGWCTFPIRGKDWQQKELTRALAIKKFTLYRDERDLSKPGSYWVSIAYEITRPDTTPFVPTQAVYIALGASYLGIISPERGEDVISLWRPDHHWKPKIDVLDERIKRSVKGSRSHKRRLAARRKMFGVMGAQQTLDHREIVIHELIRYHKGKHFVVADLPIRSKKGGLADSFKAGRGGSLGLNWAAQNTGSIAQLVDWLAEKAQENGGMVHKHRLIGTFPPSGGAENKILIARALRDDFLRIHPDG